ncbi:MULTISPECIES: DUF998 domain-containing protein [unclassified Amycolatopsis]|uniref:DUF998 domain-containing protein n=1 Tax=unclassified Amycolatopsis TaxID=2618356 RepID=UPI0028740F79|nr:MULTISPECIES: DUF998 domain-containing protein [unclassified Amycolatopsis]MDS0138459.1 DUF998 domain-containing protein [Amycolatopsis sp. 505]MDS0146264.1 DUF998 domain-containing protein [Amycolatopsis sp. CM201R]
MTTATRSPQTTLVHSYLFLRRAIGLIGLALPFVLILGKQLVQGGDLLGSLSSYYYTDLRDVLVGAMCAVGVFLLAYYGHDYVDNIASTVAGLGAIGLALFPTTPDHDVTGWDRTVGVLHLAFAAVFFLSLAYFCLRLFPHDGEQPEKFGALYRVCGGVILVCLVLIALAKYLGLTPDLHPALWLEAVAVEAFGVAWAVKGGTLKPRSVP